MRLCLFMNVPLPCSNGGSVSSNEKRFRKFDKDVEDLSIVLDDHAVQHFRVHRLQGAAQVHTCGIKVKLCHSYQLSLSNRASLTIFDIKRKLFLER